MSSDNVAVIIPAYKVSQKILFLVEHLIQLKYRVYVVDDCCPEKSGGLVQNAFQKNQGIDVIFHQQNQGVGGAVLTGYATPIRAMRT